MNISLFIGMRYTGTRRRSQLVSFISRVCIVGLVISVALLIVILSVMNGFDKEFRERMLAIIPQVTVQNREGIEDWRSLRDLMARVPGVIDSAPFIEVGGLMFVDRRNVHQALVYGVDPTLESNVSAFETYLNGESLNGESLNGENLPNSGLGQLKQTGLDRGIFLGKGLAGQLSVVRGDHVKIAVPGIGIEGFTVLGTFETGTEVDNSFALTSIDFARPLSAWNDSSANDLSSNRRVSGLRLKLDDIFMASSLSNFIYTQVLPPNEGYYTTNWTRTHSNLYYAIRQSKELVGLLLILIIGIAAFNLVSTLVMVVVDKQSDIAILRTLGASTKKIMGVFMVQGCFIGVIGTGVGLIIGIPLAYEIEDIVQVLERLFDFQLLKSDSYPISFVPTDPLFADIFYITVTALVLSLIATIYPAWRASRVKPAEALRFEV